MYAVRPTPTPTMPNVSLCSTSAAPTSNTVSGDHHRRANSVATYGASPGLEAQSPWQLPRPGQQPQNSAYGISYASHGASVNPPQSSLFANDQSESLSTTHCASKFEPRAMYGTHQAAVPLTVASSTSQAYAPPRGGQYTASTSVDIKQEIKEEEADMDWLETPASGEQSYLHASQTSIQQPDPGDATRTNEAELSPFVKPEQSHLAYYETEILDGSLNGSTQSMLFTYGSPNVAAYAFAQEYSPDSEAGDWMPAVYVAEDGTYIPVPPWPYTPSESFGEAYPVHEPNSRPTPITNHRSYTLENAITPITPIEKRSQSTELATISSQGERPVMDRLSPPEEGMASSPPPSSSTASPDSTSRSRVASAPSLEDPRSHISRTHGQPIRRGRGRPRKHPSSRSSPPPAVNYPYPSLDTPFQPASSSSFDAQPQRRWMDSLYDSMAEAGAQQPQVSLDEIPFPEGAEHPGQQMFKLTAPGTPKEPVKKKPIMACLFCRERKIACGSPDPTSPEQRCNQCSRRNLPCQYPKESRRGMHKRFPRPPKTKDPDAVPAEGTEPSKPGDVQMAAVDGSRVSSPVSSPSPTEEKQAARRRTGKERERSDAGGVRDPRKATQRRAGASSSISSSLMEASAAGASPH